MRIRRIKLLNYFLITTSCRIMCAKSLGICLLQFPVSRVFISSCTWAVIFYEYIVIYVSSRLILIRQKIKIRVRKYGNLKNKKRGRSISKAWKMLISDHFRINFFLGLFLWHFQIFKYFCGLLFPYFSFLPRQNWEWHNIMV